MVKQLDKIDEAANNWNKTKDLYYKDLWYQLIKEFANGPHNINDGIYYLMPITKKIMDGIVLTSEISCLDLCDILRLKLTGYVDTLNLHIMNDGSGSLVGCICK